MNLKRSEYRLRADSHFTHRFGKRYGNADQEQLRTTECLVLEPSEMIAVDYPDGSSTRISPYSNVSSSFSIHDPDRMTGDPYLQPSHHHSPTRDSLAVHTSKSAQPRRRLLSDNSIQMGASTMDLSSSDRSSRGSDDTCSSGAFSGVSNGMHLGVNGASGVHSTTSDSLLSTSSVGMDSDVNDDSEDDEDVDNIEDLLADGEESISASSCTFRDTVREALEMPPADRCQDKEAMDILLDFMQRLPAFAGFTQSVQRELCGKMQYVCLEESGYVVLEDGEKLDSWAVIINGAVQVQYPDGTSVQLHAGDCYGILSPTMEALYHRGVMRTLTEDCQFACVAQEDYWEILSQEEEHTRKIENETGQVVMVIEHRLLTGHTRRCPLVIKATPERLIAHLMEENSMNDPFYIEDFLLTYRTFLPSPTDITDCLMRWYADTTLRDRAIRIVLLWVNNHFIDFERYPAMIAFLEQFQYSLETHKKASQLRLLHIACAAKARQRTITLTKSTREEQMNFSILGGWDRGFGIFICDVKKSSKAEELGLRRGDQILQVNGVRFEHVTHSKALDVLRSATHLSITVKSNLLGYREMLITPADSPRHRHRHRMAAGGTPQHRLSSSDVLEKDVNPVSADREVAREAVEGPKKHFMTLGNKARLKKALMKMNLLAKDLPGEYVEEGMPVLAAICTDPTGNAVFASNMIPRPLQHSRSNPDLTAGFKQECLIAEPMSCNDIVQQDTGRSQYPDHVLKVYKGADQTCKHLLVHKETTAREVVMLALAEFGIHEPSQNFCLCQVSVEAQNVIKQRRLPDEIANLADSIPLNGRYYLKNNRLQETLVADDVAPDIWRESQISLLQLNTVELAAQLTLQDFAIFKQIEATDYIEELFNLTLNNPESPLHKFENVVNKEMFWVITEICGESALVRRVKIVKHFIKIAKYLHEAKNINSCFAILSGLNHGCVARLKQTWDRVGGKYMKIFESLSMLMDPSRNMNKYRQLLAKWAPTPPVIPFYPVVRKDLTFLHEGNDSHDGDLINFEKLRMISKEIRLLKQYTSSPYFLQEMIDGASGILSLSSLAMSSGRKSHGSRSLPSRKKSNTIMSVSAKKLYEEAQMVRKVKQYWNNFLVINDEDRLHSMSLTCEPSTAPIRRQHSVPEQVSSFAGPKFGQRSPQAVRRLLDLSDSTKVRHNANHAARTRREQPRSSAISPKPPYASGRRTAPVAYPNHGSENAGSFGFLRPPYATRPADLSAESTSVIAIRKSQSGSVASTESSHSMTDSGLANSCSSSVQSSPSLIRGCTPPATPYTSLSSSSCSSTVSTMVRSVVSRPPTTIPSLPPREVESFTTTTRHRPRAPPDYVAATMARPVPPPYNSMAPPSVSATRKPYSNAPITTKLKSSGNGSMV